MRAFERGAGAVLVTGCRLTEKGSDCHYNYANVQTEKRFKLRAWRMRSRSEVLMIAGTESPNFTPAETGRAASMSRAKAFRGRIPVTIARPRPLGYAGTARPGALQAAGGTAGEGRRQPAG